MTVLPDPCCPICQGRDFEPLAERRYHRAQTSLQTPYVRRRYQVVFDIWAPEEDVFAIVFVLCRSCGTVIYRPRPQADDLERKYRFLTVQGAPPRSTRWQRRINSERSDELFEALEPFLEPQHRRVLDYGGGDGKLMASLIRERGLKCSLVDYVPQPILGVEHLANTLEDMPDNERFDAIVCSHVLEHLADPVGVLQGLRRHLDPKGLLFAEVPLEIWGAVPAPVEPVTHVNYFSPASLRCLFQISGYRVLRCWTTTPRHPTGTFKLAVRAVAQAATDARWSPVPEDVAATQRLMQSGLMARPKKACMYPKLLLNWPLRAWRKLDLALSG